jgi:hypothetical protein
VPLEIVHCAAPYRNVPVTSTLCLMKRLLCTAAVMCVVCHASAAADAEWLRPAPSTIGPRASWQSSPAGAFVEVAVSKFGFAESLLSERPFIQRSPAEVTSLLGPQPFTCGAGTQAYLVRALYSGNGAFSLLWAADTLVVAHGSLGAAGPGKRSALVACLARQPAAVVSVLSGAI